MIRQVQPLDVDTYWSIVGPMLRAPLELADEGYTLDDVYIRIKEQTALLWLWQDADKTIKMAGVFTNVNNWLYCWLISGTNMQLWLDDCAAAMKRYAETYGMKGCSAVTRKGIAKELAKRGWKGKLEHMQFRVESSDELSGNRANE